MEKTAIKKVSQEELGLLQSLGRQTFSETFSSDNSEENMTKYLEERFSEEKLINDLQAAGSEFYFAILENRAIGYLKINLGLSQTELKGENALEIERIYVLNEFHGKKVGQLLYEKAISIARHKKVDFIWLGVWEENRRAICFYRKNGFVKFDQHIFKLGDEEQTDILMKLELE